MAFASNEQAISPAGSRVLRDSARQIAGVPGHPDRFIRAIVLLSLVLVDGLGAQAAFYLGNALYGLLTPEALATSRLGGQLAMMALVLPVGYCLLDVYRVHGQAPIERFPLRIKTTCALFALLIGWHYVSQRVAWPPGAAALTCLFAIVLSLTGESIVRSVLIRWGLWSVPVVVIGAKPTSRQVVRALRRMPELGLRPVGLFVDHDPDDSAATVENVPILGAIADSANYSGGIETAIVTLPAEAEMTVDAIAMQHGYRNIIVVPDLHGLPTLSLRTCDLNGFIGLQMQRSLLRKRNRLLKQAIDHSIALPLVVLGAPLILALGLWVMAVSKGSPFYTQLRAGKGGHPIKIWKLRTMYPDAEERLEDCLSEDPAARQEWERYCKLTNDPRILPVVGHFLRRTSLDELPQIFNVIRGEMSLVGPRPFPDYHLDHFEQSFQLLRSTVVPGLTGLWQISARSDGDLAVQQALDTYYIRNWSIWIDLYILFQTVGAVLAARGAR